MHPLLAILRVSAVARLAKVELSFSTAGLATTVRPWLDSMAPPPFAAR